MVKSVTVVTGTPTVPSFGPVVGNEERRLK